MAIGRRDRPERLANDVSARTVTGPGAKTGVPGDATSGKDKPVKGKKSLKLKVAVGLVVLLVAGAGAKFTVLAPSSAAETAKAKPKPGPVIQLDETTLNLTEGHYLRMKVALQTTKGTSEEIDTSEAAQLVIDQYSNRSVAQLTGDAARTKSLNALVLKLQKAYPKQIMGAFYTEFVMTG